MLVLFAEAYGFPSRRIVSWLLVSKLTCRKYPSDKGSTVAISGAPEEVVELGWIHAKMHHAHKDEEEKALKDWIRANAEAAND